jgi:hypothetical protein
VLSAEAIRSRPTCPDTFRQPNRSTSSSMTIGPTRLLTSSGWRSSAASFISPWCTASSPASRRPLRESPIYTNCVGRPCGALSGVSKGHNPCFSLGPSCPRLRRYPRPIWATSPPRSGKSTRWRGSASTASTRPPGDVAPHNHRAKDPPPAPASRHRHPARTPTRFSAGADSHARPPQVVVASHSSRPGSPHRGCGEPAGLQPHLTVYIGNQRTGLGMAYCVTVTKCQR